MDSAQALIIIALRAKAVETAIDHMQPKMVAVVTSQESIDDLFVGCMPFRERGVEFKWHPMDDYDAALEHLSVAKKDLGVDFEDPALADRSSALLNRLGENQPFLGRLRKKGRGHLSLEEVVDMIENARRRIVDQRRYDDGVARLYRSMEMWHQWRLLSLHSIETETVKWERVDEDVRQRFLELVQTKTLPEGLGLRHARTLDHLLSGKDPEEDDATFQKLLSARNSSILAHGVDPVGRRRLRSSCRTSTRS